MTKINSQENISSVQGERPLVENKASEKTTVAETSETTAHGTSVNIGAQKALLSYKNEEPSKETIEALKKADKNPHPRGIQNFKKATGFSDKDMAKIAANYALAA